MGTVPPFFQGGTVELLTMALTKIKVECNDVKDNKEKNNKPKTIFDVPLKRKTKEFSVKTFSLSSNQEMIYQ